MADYGINITRGATLPISNVITGLDANKKALEQTKYRVDAQRELGLRGYAVQEKLGGMQDATNRYNIDAQRELGLAKIEALQEDAKIRYVTATDQARIHTAHKDKDAETRRMVVQAELDKTQAEIFAATDKREVADINAGWQSAIIKDFDGDADNAVVNDPELAVSTMTRILNTKGGKKAFQQYGKITGVVRHPMFEDSVTLVGEDGAPIQQEYRDPETGKMRKIPLRIDGEDITTFGRLSSPDNDIPDAIAVVNGRAEEDIEELLKGYGADPAKGDLYTQAVGMHAEAMAEDAARNAPEIEQIQAKMSSFTQGVLDTFGLSMEDLTNDRSPLARIGLNQKGLAEAAAVSDRVGGVVTPEIREQAAAQISAGIADIRKQARRDYIEAQNPQAVAAQAAAEADIIEKQTTVAAGEFDKQIANTEIQLEELENKRAEDALQQISSQLATKLSNITIDTMNPVEFANIVKWAGNTPEEVAANMYNDMAVTFRTSAAEFHAEDKSIPESFDDWDKSHMYKAAQIYAMDAQLRAGASAGNITRNDIRAAMNAKTDKGSATVRDAVRFLLNPFVHPLSTAD